MLEPVVAEDEQTKKKRLLEALNLLATSYDKKFAYQGHSHALTRLATSAVEGSRPDLIIIAQLHKDNSLEKLINELKAAGELKGITPQEISAVLRASANAKRPIAAAPSAQPSAGVNYPARASHSRTPFILFNTKDKTDRVRLGVAVGAGVLGVGALVTAFTCMGLATTTITTSTVAMAAVATAAAAGAVFPPVGIAILAIAGAALLITGIALAAIALQHHRQQKQFEELGFIKKPSGKA